MTLLTENPTTSASLAQLTEMESQINSLYQTLTTAEKKIYQRDFDEVEQRIQAAKKLASV